ncbi:uncharacterized protein DSM5745_05920 [Aspergillus mulundensis]|uniref:Nucleoside phosphorylase domain-containing protein n=1 Tax=Aspergillus mulundensis TaxID=1810919 RepID=A0A3D8RYI5_9EURO|nr:hypothetical protein DSM5745_05920 [Aspergillus mulundensis]RDW79068.1 hypothetical protein DSM5745_05920 [Aspergillus mulundensis]
MKSGEDRDNIARQESVLCFEMEGAGVFSSLPCIVIKGVSDYADSHKDKIWQSYSAGTAAACAKALLEQWSVTDRSSLGTTTLVNVPRAEHQRNSASTISTSRSIERLPDILDSSTDRNLNPDQIADLNESPRSSPECAASLSDNVLIKLKDHAESKATMFEGNEWFRQSRQALTMFCVALKSFASTYPLTSIFKKH